MVPASYLRMKESSSLLQHESFLKRLGQLSPESDRVWMATTGVGAGIPQTRVLKSRVWTALPGT